MTNTQYHAAHQYNPAVAYNDDDAQWLVVWHDGRNGTNYGIYGQRVDRNGTLLGFGAPITIWDDANSLQNPAVAYDTTQRRYLVVWQNVTSPAIEGRVINADGTFYSSRFSITTGTLARTVPDVAYNPVMDEYLVVWQHAEATGGDIRARKVSTEGVIDPGGTYAISDETADERYPAVEAYPADGRYLVVWSSDRSGSFNVVGRRLLSNGSVTGSLFGISTGSGQEYYPDLAFNPANGQALVVWLEWEQGTLRWRPVNSDNTRGTEFLISGDADPLYNTAIAYSPLDSKYLVIWNHSLNIHGQWVNSNGSVDGGSFLICNQMSANVALAFGPDRFLAAWQDLRNSTWDIYGQLVSFRKFLYLPLILR